MDSISEMALTLTDTEKIELIRILALSMVNYVYANECIALLDELRGFRSELTYDQVWGE